MRHVVEVDQSTKIEQSGPTILAFSNGIAHAILIPSRVKMAGLHALLARGKSREVAYTLLFATGLFLLLENHLNQFQRVEIDVEYMGKDADIRGALLRYIRRKEAQFGADKIAFRRVGKKSPADRKARGVRDGKDKTYRKITLKEMLDLVA